MTDYSRKSVQEPTIVLVGCGAIAESFYLPALSVSPVRDSLILVDSDPARARGLAARFGVGTAMSDYREVVSRADGVIIAVPHHLHHVIAKEFLQRGVHVLCEKPLAESAAAAQEMIQLADTNGSTITVNHTRRLMWSSEKVKELLSAGSIGMVRSLSYLDGGEFNWPAATGFYFDSRISKRGVLLDIGSHVIDLLCWWLEAKPRLVSSLNDSFGGIEAVIALELAHQKCSCAIRLSRLSKLPNRFKIEGEEGVIEGDVYGARTVSVASHGGRSTTYKGPPQKEGFLSMSSRLVSNFLGVIRGEESPLIPAKDVLPAMELIDEAYARAKRFPMPWYEPREVTYAAR